jgi:outer membrane protein TolC
LPIFTGGKISGSTRLQRENLLASGNDLEARRLETAYRTRRAYLQLLLTEHLLRSAESSAERVDIILGNTINLMNAGLADSLDILEARLAQTQAELAVSERQVARDNVTATLAQLLGLDEKTEIVASDSVAIPESLSDFCRPPELSRIERPELAGLNRQAAAAMATAQVVGAGLFPDLAGYLGYSVGKPNRDMFDKTWNDYFSVGATLTWNLNLGGQTIRERSAAVEKARSIQMAQRLLQEKLDLQARTAYNDAQRALQTLRSRETEVELARDKYRLGQNKREAGTLTVNRLLELEQELAAAEQLLEAAKVDCHLAITDYWYAIGSARTFGRFQP